MRRVPRRASAPGRTVGLSLIHIFDQNVAAGHHGKNKGFAQMLLTDQGLREACADAIRQGFRLLDVVCGQMLVLRQALLSLIHIWGALPE